MLTIAVVVIAVAWAVLLVAKAPWDRSKARQGPLSRQLALGALIVVFGAAVIVVLRNIAG
jgi:hypothetical protein